MIAWTLEERFVTSAQVRASAGQTLSHSVAKPIKTNATVQVRFSFFHFDSVGTNNFVRQF